ncbi:aldo/keto reductase [Mangrovibacillus cuniculi]|uniref:Aldo/keto reductase n=1 Tax=Mangrovibacillus cuniculi TaxID=2593652 RepID=A0A7S8CB93_9BACI|nr:aldo/keto reductase [Mangrovibacillus cuniculi]QPC46767.1 aldo/keto reductase [Mangrovibacillus cuniculi]
METRKLGSSNLFVTAVGFGCMSIGTDKRQAKKILETAYDQGIRYFDTADLYDQGVNEEIVGEFLKSVGNDIILATKVGNRFTPGEEGWTWDPSKKYIKEQVKSSLARLKVDKIDLYQLHGGTMDDPLDEVIEAFEELKQECFIQEYGISSIRPTVINYFTKHSSIASVMIQHSMLDQRPEEQAYPLLDSNRISVVTRGPVAKGILTESGFAKKKEMIRAKGYNGMPGEEVIRTVEKVREWGMENGYTLEELALQYNLAHNPVASVVVGASSPEQITETVKAFHSTPLTKEQLKELKSLLPFYKYEAHRI